MSTNIEDKSAIGCRWREERERLSLSRKEVADACRRTQQGIGEYERGVSMPGGQALLGFSELGADINYILTGNRCERQKVDKNTRALNDEQKRLLDTWYHIPTEAQHSLVALMDQLARIPKSLPADDGVGYLILDPDKEYTQEELDELDKERRQRLKDISPATKARRKRIKANQRKKAAQAHKDKENV